MNTLGLLTLHRSYVKEFVDFSFLGLNFGNNFRFVQDLVPDLDPDSSHFLCTFESGDIMSLKIEYGPDGIALLIKNLPVEEQYRTLASGIEIVRTKGHTYLAL